MLHGGCCSWHHVETLEGSVSLATLTHENTAKEAMTVIYKLDHKFDRLQDPRGKRYALRLFLDMMVHELVGNAPRETLKFFNKVLHTRWRMTNEEEGVGVADEAPVLCDAERIPVAEHVYGDCTQDTRLVTRQFGRLQQPEVRDVLFLDYIEEMAADVVGPAHVRQFFHDCFREGQEYALTNPGSDEHVELWRYYDEDVDGALD